MGYLDQMKQDIRLYITEVHNMNKTVTKKLKQTRLKLCCSGLVNQKRAVLNGFTKSHFKIFPNVLYKGKLPVIAYFILR